MSAGVKILPLYLATIHRLLWYGFVLLAVSGIYLATVSLLEWSLEAVFQGIFYQWMFLGHIILGLLLTLPVVWFIGDHLRRGIRRPNRRAVRMGLWLAASSLLVLLSGVVLIRFDGFSVASQALRDGLYWLHVLVPLLLVLQYSLHRRRGHPMSRAHLRWRLGIATGLLGIVIVFNLLPGSLHHKATQQAYLPSQLTTEKRAVFSERDLLVDNYCKRCHQSISKRWQHSAHHFSSLSNPVYRFAVENTRRKLMQQVGDNRAARFCAGCHDPVLLLTGEFDKPRLDPTSPAASAGVNCISCHAITGVANIKGNASYILKKPAHYPFAFSNNKSLRWLSDQLVKAKPELHQKTFLNKSLKTTQFCATCHKVHIPKVLNHYRWLRGQDHFDEFMLSGVSGFGVASFYYPKQAQKNCNQCHMPERAATDIAAFYSKKLGRAAVHDHLFPSANTALQNMAKMPAAVMKDRILALKKSARVQIFGYRRGGEVDGVLVALRHRDTPLAQFDAKMLLEIVIKTTGMGHWLTGGTTDSNQLWLDTEVELVNAQGQRLLVRSGAMDAQRNIDPSAHFVRAYLLDRRGRRIAERNVEDIFVPLYNTQIPPGAADVVHYRLNLPPGDWRRLTVSTHLNYRKFSEKLFAKSLGHPLHRALPVVELARDRISLFIRSADHLTPVVQPIPVQSSRSTRPGRTAPPAGTLEPLRDVRLQVPLWKQWNDYGIGLFRKGKGLQFKQAEAVFQRVEQFGRADGALNLTRIYLKQGRLQEATAAVNRALSLKGLYPWTARWLRGRILRQQGRVEDALEELRPLLRGPLTFGRLKLDFSQDYRLLNLIARIEIEAARLNFRRKPARSHRLLKSAEKRLEQILVLDPENAEAYFSLAEIARRRGQKQRASHFARLHQRYTPDDLARSRVVLIQRQASASADAAAEPVVVHSLLFRRVTEKEAK